MGITIGSHYVHNLFSNQLDSQNQNWPMYLADSYNSGHFDSSVDLSDEDVRENTLATFEGDHVTSPVLVDGNFFVCSYRDENYSIYKVENGDKDLIVTSEYEDDSVNPSYSDRTTPAINDGMVYITTSYGINAFDIETGTKVWFTELRGIHSPPTVLDGSVYLAVPTSTTSDSGFVSLDSQTGEIEWEFDTGAVSHANHDFAVAVSENNAILSDNDGYVNSVSASTGETNWEFTKEDSAGRSPSPGIPTIIDETIYCNISGEIVALNLNTGDQIWDFSYDAGHSLGAPAVANDTVIGFDDLGKVYGLNREDGTLAWTTDEMTGGARKITISDNMIFFYRGERIDVYDIETGTTLNKIESSELATSSDGDDYSINSMGPLTSNGISVIARSDDLSLSIITEGSDESDEEEPNEEDDAIVTIFQQSRAAVDNPLLLGAGGVTVAGMSYAGYKYLNTDDDDSTKPPETTDSNTSARPSSSAQQSPKTELKIPDITSFEDLSTTETIKTYGQFQVATASTSTGNDVWVIIPSTDNKTIPSEEYEALVDQLVPWSQMDAHPHLLTVFEHGSDPLPWAAIEPADSPTLTEQVDEFSTQEVLEILRDVCDGVHHVKRYGMTYEQLSMDSILVDDEGTAKLRGILDHLASSKPTYELPDTDEDPTTDQADVYRLGALAYETITGSLPDHPDVTPPSVHDSAVSAELDDVLLLAVAIRPADRQDTVLHLRDQFQAIISS